MNEYRIKWEIDLNAENPLDAAKKALEYIINTDAKVFTMQNKDTKECHTVDLAENEGDEVYPLTVEEFKS